MRLQVNSRDAAIVSTTIAAARRNCTQSVASVLAQALARVGGVCSG